MWLKKIFRTQKQTGPREVKAVLGLNDELSNFLQFGSKGGETASSAINLYNDSSAVSIPINKIAGPFKCLKPVLRFGDETITDHPVLDLIRNPNAYSTQSLFLETLAKDYLITNETHIVAIGSINRPPLELRPISPSNVSINNGERGTPGNIMITGQSLAGTYEPDLRKKNVRYLKGAFNELYYIRGYSTKDNSLLRGQSLLISASAEARQHILGGNHNVSLLEKGGRVSLVFHFEEEIGADDLKAVKQRLNEEYSGANKAGAIGVTAGGKMNIEELSKNNRDMDFAQLQQMAKFAVAMQYDLPLPLITTDAATFDNYKESKLALYDDAVFPLADTIFGGLSTFLLPRFSLDPAKYHISYDVDSITAIKMRRNAELLLLKQLDVLSDNEIRAEMSRDDYDGGDTHYKPANLIPTGKGLLSTDDE